MASDIDILLPMVQKGDRVLEVGCGSGDILHQLAVKKQAYGIGIDPAAYSNYDDVVCKRLAGERISELNEKFDIVFSIHSLHHLSAPMQMFRGAAGLLEPGGKVVIIDWKHNAETGVPEYYFTKDELLSFATETGYVPLHYYIDGDEQILVAVPIRGLRVAVAVDDDTVSHKIYGRASIFDIYEKDGEWSLIEKRENPIAQENPAGKTFKIIEILRDCNIFVGKSIGSKGEVRTLSSGRLFVDVSAKMPSRETLKVVDNILKM